MQIRICIILFYKLIRFSSNIEFYVYSIHFQLIGDQYSDHTLGLKSNIPTRSIVNDHQKIKETQSHKNGLTNENRNAVVGNMKSHSVGSLASKANHCLEAKKVDSSLSSSSLDSTRSSDSGNTLGKKRNRFTKLSSVGSSVNIPSLTDGWVPLDWSPDFDSAKLYNSSEFPDLH